MDVIGTDTPTAARCTRRPPVFKHNEVSIFRLMSTFGTAERRTPTTNLHLCACAAMGESCEHSEA
jgi:hypothetical protein